MNHAELLFPTVNCKNKTKLICHDGDSTSKTRPWTCKTKTILRIEDIHSAPALLSWSLTLAHSKNLHRAITYISCRHQHVSQRGDVVVSVEPRHEQDAEPHVHQERHQDVAFPADRHQSGDAALQSARFQQQFQYKPGEAPFLHQTPTSWTAYARWLVWANSASSCVRSCSWSGHMWTVYWTGSAAGKDWRSCMKQKRQLRALQPRSGLSYNKCWTNK